MLFNYRMVRSNIRDIFYMCNNIGVYIRYNMEFISSNLVAYIYI